MRIALTPKQIQLKNEIEFGDAPIIGFGGARGGAKSHGVRELALLFALKYGIKCLILRKYSDDLLKNHINPWLESRPELRKYINFGTNTLCDDNRRVLIKFDYAEKENNIYKVAQGPEYQIVFVDEATQLTEFMLTYVRTCNRDPQYRLPKGPKTIYTMNPGGKGHQYVKRVFIDRIFKENEQEKDYAFIQASVWDNVFWALAELERQGFSVEDYYYRWTEKQRIDFTLKYSQYAKLLAGLPEQLKLAYLFGDWNVFAGLFFNGFDVTKEAVTPFEIPKEWPLVGSLDPGFAAPLSFGLTTKDFKGNIFRIGTYYAVDKIPTHAQNIKTWLTDENSPIYPWLKGRMPDYTVAGRDAFSKLDGNAIQSNEETVEDHFRQNGINLINGNDGPNTRIKNWWNWKGLFPDRYFVFKNLNNPLLTQITTVESDPDYPEDILGRGGDATVEDHAIDEQKLAIAALSTPKEKEKINLNNVPRPSILTRKNKLSDPSLRF